MMIRMINKLKGRTSVTVALWMMCAWSVAAQEAAGRQQDKRAKAEDFIIFPWGNVPTPDFTRKAWGDMSSPDDLMKDLFDCGYNATGFIPASYVPSAEACRLATILYDSNVASYADVTPQQADETVRAALNKIESPELRRNVYALYVKDEPHASLFPRLGRWAEAIRKQGVLPYINLFPDNASDEQLGSDSYEAHLDTFMSHCRPSYVSYDNYSLYDDGTLNEDRFYGNLETVRRKSQHAAIPFWNVILGNSHFHYIEPSIATLSVQVYSTLAYGGRGIGYFTHYAPALGNYRLAPVDQFGYRTKTWESVRHINLQIHALAPVYCTLKSINVFHTGGDVPRNAQGINSAILLERIGKGRLLVGEFVDPAGKPYLLIVNKDIWKSARLEVAFKQNGRLMLVSPYGGGLTPFAGEQDWLAPGAGALLTLDE
jgi:hypothetical protein